MRMCEACGRGEHYLCGMQTWCECECDGSADYDLYDDVEEITPEQQPNNQALPEAEHQEKNEA